MSIGRASQLLGVTPATLRQWTTMGIVHAYRTPGGHRRFSASELASLAEAPPPATPRSMAQGVIEQLRQRYRGLAQSVLPQQSWMAEIDDSRRERFHELGDALLGCLGQYLTNGGRPRRQALEEARVVAASYGRLCRQAGLDTARAVEAYVLFRRPLLDVLGRNLSAHPAMGTQLSRVMRDAERFMDEFLAAVTAATAAPHLQDGARQP